MTNEEIAAFIWFKYQGAHWNLSGNTYAGLVWLDDPSTKPTAQDLGL